MAPSLESDLVWLEKTFDELWPLCRSIMGPGFRESFQIIQKKIPLEVLCFASGEQIFDWKVPDEWRPKEAYFIDPKGKKHAEFSKNNLHLLNYSAGFRGRLTKAELEKHLYTLPELPDAIPYLQSYYHRRWGFCISENERLQLPEGDYEVLIDAEHVPGFLEVGECVLKGESSREVLFSSYICHPSLANNELSGPLCLALLYERLSQRKRRFTYRFVLSAETIGTVAYLSKRGAHLREHLLAGYQMTCLGDRGDFTYKKTRDGDEFTDRMALGVLKKYPNVRIVNFDPADGSDERQYSSPGFALAVGSLMRTMYNQYKEYHTSLDNKSFIDFRKMLESVRVYEEIVDAIENSEIFINQIAFGEPQLEPRGLYPSLGGQREIQERVRALMWLLNLSDGRHELSEIARRGGLEVKLLRELAADCVTKGLLRVL